MRSSRSPLARLAADADTKSPAPSARDTVYHELKEAILLGRCAPGVHLKEREIAREFKVSTTPVKEAFRLLQQEGLVVTRPRVGTYVCNDIMRSVVEIRLARSALEGVAARLAAMKATPEEVEQLRRSVQEIGACARRKDVRAMVEACERFDRLVQAFARNTYIGRQLESIRFFDRCAREKIVAHRETMDLLHEEHRRIYQCIARHNPEGAEEASREHVRRSTRQAVNGGT